MRAIAAILVIILWTGLVMWMSLLQKQYRSKIAQMGRGFDVCRMQVEVQGGSNMTRTDLCVNSPGHI